MLLPCRTCIFKSGGVEVRKRLDTFTTATSRADFWKEIERYQNLEFIRCYQSRKGGFHSGVVYCETCELYRPTTTFAKGAEQILMAGADGFVQCEQCEYWQPTRSRANMVFVDCAACKDELPENAFQYVRELRSHGRCSVRGCEASVMPL